jgi:PAS domain S-box-containing protein
MTTRLRKTGISIVGDMPWGTHFCHFYDTKEDLLDTLVPYFKAGLEDNEFCVWVVSEPLTEEEASSALRQAVPNLDKYFADRSLEILTAREWYLEEGVFDLRRVMTGWDEKLGQALIRGYAGMRVSGSSAWLAKKDWADFYEYEKQLNESITDQRMTVLCTYPIAATGAAEILDVARNHQFVMAKRGGNWDIVETSELKQARNEIKKLNEDLEQRVIERTEQLSAVNLELRKEIIEHNMAEGMLRAANARVEMILDSMTDRFFALDSEWRYTYFNKHAEAQLEILGKNPSSLIGRVLWDEFPSPPTEEEFRRAMRERTVITDEHYYPPLGEWVQNRIYPGPDGGLAIFQSYITERKRNEQRLATQYSITRILAESDTLAEATPSLLAAIGEGLELDWGALWVIDRESTVIRCQSIWHAPNVDAAEFDAISRETTFSPGQPLAGYVWKSASPTWIGDATNNPYFVRGHSAARVGLRGAVAFPIMLSGQTLGVIELFSRAVQQPDKEQIATLSAIGSQIGQFIERKRAEEELRRSEAYLAEGQRISHTGSWVWNISTGELFWSQEHFRIFGVDPGTVKPSYEMFFQIVHPEDKPSMRRSFDRAVRERIDYEADFRILRSDGITRHIHSLAHPVCNESGELTDYVGTVIDTTERNRAEERLQKAQAELAHVARVMTLGEMTASIAHEVNQPLAAIVTNGHAGLRLLSHEVPDLDGTREAIECTISDAMRASEVIKRIRALLKKTIPEKAWLHINRSIEDVIALASSEIVRNKISLRLELEADIPPALGDHVQLQQVLLNLILNSKDAMSRAGWQPRELQISSQMSKPVEVMVSVRDSGIGLDPQDSERIFDTFFTTKEGGLGLGLPISRTIIESHGGRLWATPNKGKGATFRFTLPVGGENDVWPK